MTTRHATTEQAVAAIAECMERGLHLLCGPHDRSAVIRGHAPSGYFAVFYDHESPHGPVCGECEEPRFDYDSVSHGPTLPDAILNARDEATS